MLEDGEKAENLEEDMISPQGKEVFKQPKLPKSIFYVFDDDDLSILGLEPTTVGPSPDHVRSLIFPL